MIQEQKELLLKDLCGRLQSKVMIYLHTSSEITGSAIVLNSVIYGFIEDVLNNSPYEIKEIKPYLRPMSSMTKEEDEWLNDRINFSRDDEVDKIRQKWGIVMLEIYNNSGRYVFSNFTEILDWLNAHHFDYRGLIEKGLAFEAPENMYK